MPPTPETLWLRLLGRGGVQQAAFEELEALPAGHPLRKETVLRVLRWRAEAAQQRAPSQADKELLMNSARLVAQWEKRLLSQGKAEGEAEGKALGELGAKAEAILTVLGARELEVSKRLAERVRSCRDRAQLDRWLVAAATAASAEEALSQPAPRETRSPPSRPRRSRR